MAETIFMAQPSLFFPYFDFTLMNVYMIDGKVCKWSLIRWEKCDITDVIRLKKCIKS